MLTSAAHRAAVIEKRVLYDRLKPPPRLTGCQWADRYAQLSSESSFRTGAYQSDDAPYQKEILDACSDPRMPRVVAMWGSQLGKTLTLNNIVGYYIDQDPAPILMLQPTKEMAEAWSKDRFAPMVRDTPRLRGKVADSKARDSGNTITHKSFAGGHLTIVGANSPAGLASRPIRVLLLDEVDRYPASAGAEGDPMAIAESRTSTFPNKKIIAVSSPTVKDGAIGKLWALSDQRSYLIPCPHCGHEQKLLFGGPDTPFGLKWDDGRPDTAHYVCAACACVIDETDKPLMLKRGRWVAENPSSMIAGFHLSALYSPFYRWSELAARFLRDKGDPLKLKTFINTILGEFWEEDGEVVDEHVLANHLHPFPRGADPDNDPQPIVPHGVGLLTRSVDVQGDRLETAVWGWGAGEEAWRVDFEIIPGDPATPEPWAVLAREIERTYQHESGATLHVPVTFIDSGGHHTKQVYDFVRARSGRRVFAIKGSSEGEGVPLLSDPRRHKSARVTWYQVGSFTGKEILMKRLLRITTPGPGFIHLPSHIDPAHLEQFLNEKLTTKFLHGRPKRVWVRTGPNEQIDLFVYAIAALHSLTENGVPVIESLAGRAAALSAYTPAPVTSAAADDTDTAPRRRPRRSNWVYGPLA